jgi:hypothetical protein
MEAGGWLVELSVESVLAAIPEGGVSRNSNLPGGNSLEHFLK